MHRFVVPHYFFFYFISFYPSPQKRNTIKLVKWYFYLLCYIWYPYWKRFVQILNLKHSSKWPLSLLQFDMIIFLSLWRRQQFLLTGIDSSMGVPFLPEMSLPIAVAKGLQWNYTYWHKGHIILSQIKVLI